MRAVHLKQLQKSNRRTILGFIREHEPVARHQIADELGLSPTTVTSAVSHLIQQDIVREIGAGPSSGGRRPIMLGINPDGGIILAVDMSSALPTRILRAAALDLKGNAIREIENRSDIQGNEALKSAIISILNELLTSQDVDLTRILAIGVGVPGLVDAESQTLILANIGVNQLHLGEELGSFFNLPVLVRNSEDVAALGEYHYGAGRDASSILYLSVGYGVGAGLVVDGEIFPRHGVSAGEIGHMTVSPDGPVCHCGNQGCLSAMVNSGAVVEQVQYSLSQNYRSTSGLLQEKEKISLAEILSGAALGEYLCKEVLQETARWLGIAVGNVINLLNPEMIIFDGDFFEEDVVFLDMVKKEVQKRVFQPYLQSTTLLHSSLGRNAGLKGIGILAMDAVFQTSMVE